MNDEHTSFTVVASYSGRTWATRVAAHRINAIGTILAWICAAGIFV